MELSVGGGGVGGCIGIGSGGGVIGRKMRCGRIVEFGAGYEKVSQVENRADAEFGDRGRTDIVARTRTESGALAAWTRTKFGALIA
ncbi:hypothetical protein F0562_018067 [Nyssa sinensis]|uniref:Uncharacterized protein n=1 Tax=Nyssa sinensis TaxID=561372 RepID=A0A5J4ZBC6_9ASTE|nr:hypothetical protein F0562_018067 [Nyssa sinensis]